jgi:hypothetical protein
MEGGVHMKGYSTHDIDKYNEELDSLLRKLDTFRNLQLKRELYYKRCQLNNKKEELKNIENHLDELINKINKICGK